MADNARTLGGAPPAPPAPRSGGDWIARRIGGLVLATTLLAFGVIIATGLLGGRGGGKDFVVIYLGTRSALSGNDPYDPGAYNREVVRFLEATGTEAIERGAFFYPPQAIVVFTPFALMPWPAAYWAWQVGLIGAAVACGSLAWTFGRVPGSHAIGAAVIVAALLLNPLTLGVFKVGQTALILCAAVAVGQWAYERGYRMAGALAWSFAAIKPHLGLPLVVLAFGLGGWRRLLEVGLVILALNLLGCLISTGRPTTLLDFVRAPRDYLNYGYNQVFQDQITSWNRVVLVAGGPAIEMTTATMLGGFLAWAALLAVRYAVGPRPWAPAYCLATATIAAPLCALSHGYDLLVLVLLAPMVLGLWDRGRRPAAAMLLLLLVGVTIPRAFVAAAVGRLGLGPDLGAFLLSYRALIVTAVALLLLVGVGPLTARDGGEVVGPAPGA